MYQYGKTVMSSLKQGRKTSWTQRTSSEEHFLFILGVFSSVFTWSAGEGHCSDKYSFLFAKDRSRKDWLYTKLAGSIKKRKKKKRKSKEKNISSQLSWVPLQCFHQWGCTDLEREAPSWMSTSPTGWDIGSGSIAGLCGGQPTLFACSKLFPHRRVLYPALHSSQGRFDYTSFCFPPGSDVIDLLPHPHPHPLGVLERQVSCGWFSGSDGTTQDIRQNVGLKVDLLPLKWPFTYKSEQYI